MDRPVSKVRIESSPNDRDPRHLINSLRELFDRMKDDMNECTISSTDRPVLKAQETKLAPLRVPALTNAKLLAVKPCSPNPADNYLAYILAEIDKDSHKEYVTWLYNYNDEGCHHGHYFDCPYKAYTDFNER